MIYLICFDRPFRHARHYLGFVESPGKLEARIERHRSGDGAKLLRAVNQAGIQWRVVRTWEDGSRDKERQMKNRGHTPDYCPVCRKNRKRNNKRVTVSS